MFFYQAVTRCWCVFLCIALFGCEVDQEPTETFRSVPQPNEVKEESPYYAPSPSVYADSLLVIAEDYIEAAHYDSAITTAQMAENVYRRA